MTDISFDTCKCGAVVVSSATAVAALKADNERLRAAISWIEPPFVDEKTPEAELRQRIAFAVADAARAALAQPAEGEK